MASIPKKTTVPTNGPARKGALSASTTTTDTPSKSPTRNATSTVAGTSTTASVNRTRSVRTNNPPASARAAARKPAGADAAEDDAKIELQSRIDELLEQLRKSEDDLEQAHQKSTVLQIKLDEVAKDQGALEENIHEHLERINDLEVEKKESLRARREMEQIFESERIAVMKEKEEMQTREHELRSSMQRLKETLSQKELRAGLDDDNRPGLQRNSSRRSLLPSPGEEMGAQFAPSASLERSDSRSSSKLVMQKDKIIESLRLELAEAQIQLVEAENFGGGHLQKLQKEMYDIKVQNARLMEENDSFQLLLRDKTLNGDFANSELLQTTTSGSSPPPSRQQGGTLADELEATGEQDLSDTERKLQAELSALRDQNKALTLYINNIVSRLLQHDQFEHILDKTPDMFAGRPGTTTAFVAAPAHVGDKDKELPPPPPEKDDQPQGFLSRARSVLGGRPSARPTSQIYDSHSNENIAPSLHTDPRTAPQVPLARTTSTRQGHRRANSDWAAASIVNNMYRGPSPSGVSNPASPGLNSPTSRAGGFFTAAQPLTTSMPPRVPSGTVPTIPETGVDDETQKEDGSIIPQRDSKLTQNRNSIVSVPDTTAGSEVLSNPSSPPRSSASHERDNRSSIISGGQPGGPSVMVGSKMRPLRLVQENAMDDEAGRKANAAANRGSWFGFLNKGV